MMSSRMELFSFVVGGSLAVALNACPAEMTQAAHRFYAGYLEQTQASRRMPLDAVIKRNQAAFAPSLYRDLLAASMRKPQGGGAYLDFDPFFNHQVKTFSIRSVGCMMVGPDRGMVEMEQVAGLSRDRATSSCLRVEMVNEAGGWRIKDVLSPSEPIEPTSGASNPCRQVSAYERLSNALQLILKK
jgi:hypothetical protein